MQCGKTKILRNCYFLCGVLASNIIKVDNTYCSLSVQPDSSSNRLRFKRKEGIKRFERAIEMLLDSIAVVQGTKEQIDSLQQYERLNVEKKYGLKIYNITIITYLINY